MQAAAESYIGLVEVGVGLIPGGGGTKEMLARAVDELPADAADLLPFVQRVFETIGFAKVSTSAADARRLGYLARRGPVTMNRERLMADAKALALERVREGYQRPAPRTAIPVGGETRAGGAQARRPPRAGAPDASAITTRVVGRALANVLAGGALPHQTTVSRAVPARSRARGVSEAVRRAQDARADPAHAEDRKAAAELTCANRSC